MKDNLIARLITETTAYDCGDPRRIQHFMKVHNFARTIGILEGLDDTTLFTLEAAAVVHDIGIHASEEKHHSTAGCWQEKEGPPIAGELLTRLGFDPEITERVCFLVGHHHTYHDIIGLDYQILVEADFLVNLYEDDAPETAIQQALHTIFRTKSGIRLCQDMFGLS